jgi:hypothetical protein
MLTLSAKFLRPPATKPAVNKLVLDIKVGRIRGELPAGTIADREGIPNRIWPT